MNLRLTEHGEIVPPSTWRKLTMDSGRVEPKGHVADVVADMRACGLIVQILGNFLVVTKGEPRDNFESAGLGSESFDMGVAPSLSLDGFRYINFR